MTTDQPLRRHRNTRGQARISNRETHYRHLNHPFAPQQVFSDDEVASLHATALRVLEELGMRMLLPEARAIFAAAGARVDEDDQMVWIGAEMVAEALRTAPRSWRIHARNPARAQHYAPGSLIFKAGSGCPNVTDRLRGRRPGSRESFRETLKLQQHFDVIHMHGPSAEPQDVPVNLRHYAMIEDQLAFGDKPLFTYGRGRGQVEDSFAMIRLAMGLDEHDWHSQVWTQTVVNTNSPRQLDKPMAEAVIDFARHGQMSIITPFCLAGAMAPVTVAGALILQHAEALACITLAQLVRPGAPVSYGGFSSNVDMKSGAPAFGTPEHVQMQIGSGQLARHIGLPWRSAAGSAGNAADMQGTTENLMGLWGSLMAGATMVIHAAGWLEGGLSFGYEKFIADVEALQSLAELCRRPAADEAAQAFEALAEVPPGGHFFAAAHTMARYDKAFYQPVLADLSNFGSWTEAGALSADQRATAVWQKILAEYTPPPDGAEAAGRVARFVADRTQAGGAAPTE